MHAPTSSPSDPLGVAYAKMAAEAGDPYNMFLRASHRLYGTINDRNLSAALTVRHTIKEVKSFVLFTSSVSQ